MKLVLQSRTEAVEAFILRVMKDDVPEDIQGHLFRYGAVLLCGHLEQCVKIVIMERLKSRAHPKIINFVKSYFNQGHNLDCQQIKALLDRFDGNWGKEFDLFVKANDEVKEGISSAYSVRNPIAHGSMASLGGTRLKELFAIVQRLIEGVEAATRT